MQGMASAARHQMLQQMGAVSGSQTQRCCDMYVICNILIASALHLVVILVLLVFILVFTF